MLLGVTGGFGGFTNGSGVGDSSSGSIQDQIQERGLQKMNVNEDDASVFADTQALQGQLGAAAGTCGGGSMVVVCEVCQFRVGIVL